jgi:glycosyltransferase involved in cell wall biosynthesis
MRARYDRIFVCSANWHPQKRLGANVELFKHLQSRQFANSCLIIMGDHPDVQVADPSIFYAGSVNPEVYMQVYSAADWMLHLAWADHSPNVVVEALSQGTPVVCGEVGGTKELVGDYGIVLKERAYGFELYDYDDPPPIDVAQCPILPSRQELDFTNVPSRIDIKLVAQRYVDLFTKLLEPDAGRTT